MVTETGGSPAVGAGPEPEAIRAQLERILASPHFTGTDRSRRFLRFVVEEALAGRSERLKEYTLAIEVFDRDDSFDPSTNPGVRVEASRLRRRLEHYYLTLGREDPVLIELPRGTYVPVFRPKADILHLQDDIAASGCSVAGEIRKVIFDDPQYEGTNWDPTEGSTENTDAADPSAALARGSGLQATDISVTNSLYHYYALLTGRAVPTRAPRVRYAQTTLPRGLRLMERLAERCDADMFCLNDGGEREVAEEIRVRAIRSALERMFPVRAPWERDELSAARESARSAHPSARR